MSAGLSELDAILAPLAEGSHGAILCDDEGESVSLVLGSAPLSTEARAASAELLPRSMADAVDPGEFALRLAGAEPCAVLFELGRIVRAHHLGAGLGFDLRFRALDLLARPLPEDFYVVVAAPPGAARAGLSRRLAVAARALAVALSG